MQYFIRKIVIFKLDIFELRILESMECNYLKFYKKCLLRNELSSFPCKKGAKSYLCGLIWTKTK